MGTPQFSVPILQALHQQFPVSLVVTQPDKQVGRKKIIEHTPVKDAALNLGIPVFQPINMKQQYQEILDVHPDLIITAAYGQMIPNEVLNYPPLGCINIHGSLLPKLRGGAPIQRAIMQGMKETGITIMYMAEKMDSGDIITQKAIPILSEDTSGTLFDKLSIIGTELLLEILPSIIQNTNLRTPQDPSLVTYAYNLRREEEHINWNRSTQEIINHLRAFTPNSYMYTVLDGVRIKIIACEIHDCKHYKEKHAHQANGTIIKIFDDAIGVKANNGVIRIKELQLAGKQRQDAKTFMQGAGRKLIQVNKQFE